MPTLTCDDKRKNQKMALSLSKGVIQTLMHDDIKDKEMKMKMK